MTSAPPSRIRRWEYTSAKGGIEKNMVLNTSAALPTPSPDQHLIQVIAVALNPVDYKPAEVPIVGRLLTGSPATPGIDFAGRMVVPAAGSSLKPGQLVFGAAGAKPFAAGGLSEYIAAPTDNIAAIPVGVAPRDAATVAVAGLTAYQSIVPHVKKGDKVFINGGSGGTGVFCVQIAKTLGCHVTTVCSSANVELCKSLGADEVVDYKKGNVADALRASGLRFNHMVDNVGEDPTLYFRSHEYSVPEAKFVMVAGVPTLAFFWNSLKMRWLPGFLGGGKRKLLGFLTAASTTQLGEIGAWMSSGEVKAVMDSRFPYEDAVKAFDRLKTGRARGKIVIEVASEQ